MGLSKSHLYSEDHNYLALLFRTLGHGARLHILEYLGDHGAASNKELVQHLGLSQSTVSEHLRLLKSMNLITATQADLSVIYSINEVVWSHMQVLARQFGEEES